MKPNTAWRAVAAGASTGGRAFTQLAALVAVTPAGSTTQPDATLRRTRVKAVAVALAAAELVADKLPQAPSRLAPPGLAGRMVTAACAGALVADRSRPDAEAGADRSRELRRDLVLGATLSLIAAVATSWLGVHGRALCASRFGDDRPGAVLEDAAVIGLAVAVARSAAAPSAAGVSA